MLRLHPKPLIYTPSYEFSVSFAGVAFGVATGALRQQLGIPGHHNLLPLVLLLVLSTPGCVMSTSRAA